MTLQSKKSWLLLAMLTAFAFIGCKKDNAERDLASLFKNTVWTGEFHYIGGTTQPVSIEFFDGGAAVWHELSGDGSGIWEIDSGKVRVTFTGADFKADISSDNAFTNVKILSRYGIETISAAMNTSAETSLDETTWTAPNVNIHFKPGNKADMLLGGITMYADIPYEVKAKFVRFAVFSGDYRWFFVKSSASLFKGVNQFLPNVTLYPFELAKK